MFGFNASGVTAAGAFFCGLLFLFIIGIYWGRCTKYPIDKRQNGTPLLFFLITLFALTAWYQGDFFVYMRNVVVDFYVGIKSFHLENIYVYIIELTGQNYILFRLVIWGGALAFFLCTVKNYRLNATLSLFLMFLLFASIFSYARASLAMAVYFLGLSVFCKGHNKKKSILAITGVCVIMSSYLFHKSMAVVIILTVFYFIPISKKTILPILFIVAVFGVFIDSYMDTFMESLMSMGDNHLADKIDEVMNGDTERRGAIGATFFGWISILWAYVPFYLSFILVAFIFFKDQKKCSSEMTGLFRITFAIVILSTSILVFSAKSLTFFYRYLYMSFIPLSILIAYLLENKRMEKKQYKLILFLGGGYNIITFLSYVINYVR